MFCFSMTRVDYFQSIQIVSILIYQYHKLKNHSGNIHETMGTKMNHLNLCNIEGKLKCFPCTKNVEQVYIMKKYFIQEQFTELSTKILSDAKNCVKTTPYNSSFLYFMNNSNRFSCFFLTIQVRVKMTQHKLGKY